FCVFFWKPFSSITNLSPSKKQNTRQMFDPNCIRASYRPFVPTMAFTAHALTSQCNGLDDLENLVLNLLGLACEEILKVVPECNDFSDLHDTKVTYKLLLCKCDLRQL